MRLLALHGREAWELQIREMATEVGVEGVGDRHLGLVKRLRRLCIGLEVASLEDLVDIYRWCCCRRLQS
jgi:hypothetical protein